MYADCHVHTLFSGDSDAPVRDQLDRAVSLGMERVCITDHNDHDVVSDIDFNLTLPEYFREMSAIRDEYSGRLSVGIGIEQGLQPHLSAYLNETAREYPFDFIIGSVHFIDGYDPYYPEYFEKYGRSSYRRYFETALECINKCDAFDSFGHLDYIVRYGADKGLSYSYREYADIIDEILAALIKKGKALECNTAQLSKGYSEPNPCRDIIRRFHELGGELVTIGSDAHSPDRLGGGFDTAGELLRQCGFKYYAVYIGREPVMKKI